MAPPSTGNATPVTKDASSDAYRTDLAQAAYDELSEDGNGADWQKETVEVTEGGK